jgi:ABC-type antimicrobial peptide transport system permease subunit
MPGLPKWIISTAPNITYRCQLTSIVSHGFSFAPEPILVLWCMPRGKIPSRKTDPQVKVDATLLSADYANILHNAYLSTGLASGLASLTLLLACLGIFALISYAASLRRRELSIRMALGATRRSVVRLLITQSTSPALWGMLFGFSMSIVALRITKGRAGGMGPYDASTFLYAASVLAVTCAVSALVPALRAVRGDLAQNLRND